MEHKEKNQTKDVSINCILSTSHPVTPLPPPPNENQVEETFLKTYNLLFWDIVEEDEVAEHGDEAEETESSHNVDHCVLQVKLS